MATEGDVELELETETSAPERPPEKPGKRERCGRPGASHRLFGGEGDSEFQSGDSHVREWRQAVQGAKAKQEREKELAKVTSKKDDLELIMTEMKISRAAAEQSLREHMGNVVEALTALTK